MKKFAYIILTTAGAACFFFLSNFAKQQKPQKKETPFAATVSKINIDQVYEEKTNSYNTSIERELLEKTKKKSLMENPIIDKEENTNLTKDNFISGVKTLLSDNLNIIFSDLRKKENNFSFKEAAFSENNADLKNNESSFYQDNDRANNQIIKIEPALIEEPNMNASKNTNNENTSAAQKPTELNQINLLSDKDTDNNLSENLNFENIAFEEEKDCFLQNENDRINETIFFNQKSIENKTLINNADDNNSFESDELTSARQTKNDNANENTNIRENDVNVKKTHATSAKLSASKKKLSEITVASNKYTSAVFLKNRIKTKPGQYINKKKLQEHLNFLNLNSFRKVEMILEDNEDNKMSIDLVCHDRFYLRPYIGCDNTGLKILDTNRRYAGLDWNNAFALDSILSYQYLASFDFKKFQSHTGHWTIFLPWENFLTIDGSYAQIYADHMLPDITKDHGSAIQSSIRYDICLPIIDSFAHDLIFGFDFKRTDTNLLFSRFIARDDVFVNLTQFLVSYCLNWNNNFYNAKMLLELYFSLGEMIGDEENEKYDNLRDFTKNRYFYAKANFSSLIKMPKDFLLSLMLTGQLANENLLPSETLALGGYNSIRGYYEREINTDSGLIFNLELRSPSISFFCKKDIADSLKLIAFFDCAYGALHKTFPYEKQNYHLMGFGPGLRYSVNTYLTTRLDWAVRGKKINGNENPTSLFHFSVNLSY